MWKRYIQPFFCFSPYRIDNERKEMQILIDKDRDDTNKKLKEEHDQRRIEQMELVQRLDNNEKCGKTDITVSFSRNILQFLYNKTKVIERCNLNQRTHEPGEIFCRSQRSRDSKKDTNTI